MHDRDKKRDPKPPKKTRKELKEQRLKKHHKDSKPTSLLGG